MDLLGRPLYLFGRHGGQSIKLIKTFENTHNLPSVGSKCLPFRQQILLRIKSHFLVIDFIRSVLDNTKCLKQTCNLLYFIQSCIVLFCILKCMMWFQFPEPEEGSFSPWFVDL